MSSENSGSLLRFFDMHYFSIHTQQGAHVGFFIMLPDDESETQPSSCKVKKTWRRRFWRLSGKPRFRNIGAS